MVTSSTWSIREGRRIRSATRAENMVITIRRPNTAVGLKLENISMEKPTLMVMVVKMMGLPMCCMVSRRDLFLSRSFLNSRL